MRRGTHPCTKSFPSARHNVIRSLLIVWGLLIASPAHAASPLAAQVCSQLTIPTLSTLQSSKGTGEGCAWQWPNAQALSVYVHIEQQDETVEAMKQVMEANLQNPVFKKAPFPVCTDGDMVVGDFKNGRGPGGVGYTKCSGFVLTFGFQGTEAQKHLPIVAKKLTGTTFGR